MFRTLFFLLFASIGFAQQSQIFDIKEIEKELKEADANTLVVFDVDDVLIMTADQFIHPYAEETTLQFAAKYEKRAKPEKKHHIDELIGLLFVLPQRILVEEITPSFIREIQEKKIKTIALTACRTGRLGHIESVEHWRVDDLRSFGIDFAASFPEHRRVVFEELTSPKRPSPLYEQGILFSNGYTKGDVLKAFLKHTGFTPSKVIFIDDRMDNLESVSNTLESLGIPCHVFHYTGASRHFKPLDPEMIEYQLHHLIQHHEWLSDSEAKMRMEADRQKNPA